MGRKLKRYAQTVALEPEPEPLPTSRCRQYPDPILLRAVEPFNTVHLQHDPSIQSAVNAMFDEMIDICNTEAGRGLSSNQVLSIASPKAAVVILTEQWGWLRLLNPKIIARSGMKIGIDERCLSVPGVTTRRMRDHRVLLRGIMSNGSPKTVQLKDLESACAQHELDHLMGKTIVK